MVANAKAFLLVSMHMPVRLSHSASRYSLLLTDVTRAVVRAPSPVPLDDVLPPLCSQELVNTWTEDARMKNIPTIAKKLCAFFRIWCAFAAAVCHPLKNMPPQWPASTQVRGGAQ